MADEVKSGIVGKTVAWFSKALNLSNGSLAPEVQRTVVEDPMEMALFYGDAKLYEFSGFSPQSLRIIYQKISPVAWCVDRRSTQICAYSSIAKKTKGFASEAGFRMCMTVKDVKATKTDLEIMTALEQMISECGFEPPPESETPLGWEPSFRNFLLMMMKDSYIMDWAVMRRWYPKNPSAKFKLSCFCPLDAGLVRRAKPSEKHVVNGEVQDRPYITTRQVRDDIKYVRIDTKSSTLVIEDYTAKEVVHFVRNPDTDSSRRGYGYPEIEKALFEVNGVWKANNYNISRFNSDSLPRGFLTVMGDVDEKSLASFRTEWKRMMEGGAKRWYIPVFKGIKGDKAAVNWNPLDMSTRDMEYHQWHYLLTTGVHNHFGVHPEETGADANSPYRPALSEVSPESKLTYSQGTGLGHVLRRLEEWINRNIVWVACPDKRYKFEFVGVGEENEAQALEIMGGELSSGLNTPRNIWNARDIPIPEMWEDHPAMDTPMPFAEGVQYFDNKIAEEEAKAQQEQQMQLQMQQQQVEQQAQYGQPQSTMPPEQPQSQAPDQQSAMPTDDYQPTQKSVVILRSPNDATKN